VLNKQQNCYLKIQRATLNSSLVVLFQDVPEQTGTSLLTYYKSYVKPKTARVSSPLFPHGTPRKRNSGSFLSLPFSPLGLFSQDCYW